MVFFLLAGCAHLYPGPVSALVDAPVSERRPPRTAAVATAPPPVPRNPQQAAVAAAQGFVGRPRLVVAGETYRFDCSGLVEASLAAAGVPQKGSSAMLFATAREQRVLHRRHLPQPGDVAFFDDTYDRDNDGRLNDPLSHSALVESVAPDGTITLIHLGSAGVVRIRMNLRHPEDARGPTGEVWNDALRARRPTDSRRTRYLAGELWVGFGSFWRAEPAVASTR